MLVFVEIGYLVVGRTLTTIRVRESEVFDVVDMRFQRAFTHTVFTHIGEGEVGGSLTFLSHGFDTITLFHGLVGLQVIPQAHIGVHRIVFGTAYLPVPVEIERNVHTPFFREELTQL